MARGIIQYRGSLKSCNYSCSYCPFSKRRATAGELDRDREGWLRFCSSLEDYSRKDGSLMDCSLEDCSQENFLPESPVASYGAVMVVPYGEALIHTYYWEGLARLSRLHTLEKAGAQTNLSFDVKQRLKEYEAAGGRGDKLQLWATFHPEMVTVDRFVNQCMELLDGGILFSAGSVGVPENIDTLRHLRAALPKNVYLWINRMDGLNRRYTTEEVHAFQEIDPFFFHELRWPKANPDKCSQRLFVESDGRMRLCNIGQPLEGNWYEKPDRQAAACGKKMCSCYLAYGGCDDYPGKWFFGRYPLFRVPWKPKALFLDLDGTLIPETGGGKINHNMLKYLRGTSPDLPLFLATSLTQKEAATRCPDIVSLLSGGIYASGAHVVIHRDDEKAVFFHEINAPQLSGLTALEKTYGFHTHFHRHNGTVYKVTLAKPRRQEWTADDIQRVLEASPVKEAISSGYVRCFSEQNCLQFVGRGIDKGSGIRQICSQLNISPRETAAIGNSPEDIPMFHVCGFGAAVAGCPEKVAKEADFIIDRLSPFPFNWP